MTNLSEAIEVKKQDARLNLRRKHTTPFTRNCLSCHVGVIVLSSIFYCKTQNMFVYKCSNCEHLQFFDKDLKKRKLVVKF